MNKLKIKELWEIKIEFQYIFPPMMKGEIEVKSLYEIFLAIETSHKDKMDWLLIRKIRIIIKF